MEHTSHSLLERISRDSDHEAWEIFHDLYMPLLQSWLRRSGLQDADVEDIVQDVLVVVARELPNFSHNGRIGAFRSWLRVVLVNLLRDSYRRRKRRPVAFGDTQFLASLDQLADPQSELSQLWNRQHDQHLFRQILKRIEPRFSESTVAAFRRVVFDQVDAKEVAQELGISLNAVVIAKCRVLKELRREGRGLLDG